MLRSVITLNVSADGRFGVAILRNGPLCVASNLASITDEERIIPLDIAAIRSRFPALRRRFDGKRAVYLDGPGGTQVPESVIEAMAGALRSSASNVGGQFAASLESQGIVDGARSAARDFVNGASPDEIVFGQNMTSVTFALAHAVAATWREGDEIVLTRLDHDANVQGWQAAAKRRGVNVRLADFGPAPECVMPVESVLAEITPRTRLVAVTRASNALGTIVDAAAIAAIAAAAHEVGALVFVDAVHYASHGAIDV